MMEFEEATSLRNPPLTTEQCKTIFSSLVVIKGFNDVLLDDLGNRISDWDEDNTLLGDIFLKLVRPSYPTSMNLSHLFADVFPTPSFLLCVLVTDFCLGRLFKDL